MKALFIGGTGTISMAITRMLAANPDWELYLLNRGSRNAELPEGVKGIHVDINDEAAVAEKLQGMQFDCVCDFIAFVPAQLERDYRLFKGRTKQFMFISSASAYQKPLASYRITESTPLHNPYWEYSRNKIACEEFLMRKYREDGFPVTIIRPSHTYDERQLAGAQAHDGRQACAGAWRRHYPVDGNLERRLCQGFRGPDGQCACHRRGVSHHLRRERDVEPDLFHHR